MRNSLALLGIPDLPIYAFRHVGDRRIQPQGGGGGIINEIIEAPGKVVESISNTLADVDDTVNKEIPGGWTTVAAIAVPAYAPVISAGSVLVQGGSVEDALKAGAISGVASGVGGEVAGQTGNSIAGSVAGGTTGGLLSGKSPEEALKGGAISGGVSLVTPSSLFTPSSSGTTDYTPITVEPAYAYVPELNIGQNTPSQASNIVVPTTTPTPTQEFIPETNIGQSTPRPQGTTGATNMADYFTNDYENYGSQDMYTNPNSAVGADNAYLANTQMYNNPYDALSADNAYMATQALTPEQLAQVGMGAPTSYLSSLDAATQALIKRALAAGGSAAKGAMNFLSQKGVAQGALGAIGSLRQMQADRQAAIDAQARMSQATQQAVAGSQFRPVGTTTRFGTSNFQTDPATGQLISAGYTAAPEITSAQNRLLGLGASYLAQTPEEVAQQYMTRQYDLLDPSRQRQLAGIRNQQFQTGRGGLSVGSTGLRPSGAQGLMGANPELEAYYNALAQQDAQLAAQAQQAGQQQVSFGTGLFGQAGQLEQLAQQPFNLSQGLAEKSSLGGVRAGQLGIQGNLYGNAIGLSGAMTANPYARALTGLADPASLLSQGIGQSLNGLFTNQFGGTPQGGQAQLGQYMAGVMANPQSQQARMLAEQEAAFKGTSNPFNTGYYDPMQQQF